MEEGKSNMKGEERDLELVSDYLYDRLNDMERAAVEQRLQEDGDFRVFYEEIKLMIQGIGSYSRRENLEKVQVLEEELSKGTGGSRSKSRKLFYWVAAAVFVLAITSSIFLLQPSRLGASALFENYYEPYPNVFEPIERSEEEMPLDVEKRAYVAYESGEYDRAAELFEDMLAGKEVTEPDIVLLYLGISYIELGQAGKARNTLKKIGIKSIMRDQARWYLSLVLLKESEKDRARVVLEELKRSGESYYSGRAAEILNQF